MWLIEAKMGEEVERAEQVVSPGKVLNYRDLVPLKPTTTPDTGPARAGGQALKFFC
jgi:hypothetical protein